MTPLTDADQLPPVQYLILELLAARVRTGEQVWSFPDRLRPQLRKLAEAGLIGWQSSPAPGACHAWFLDPGRTLMLLDDFQTPVTRLEKALEELHGRLAEARAELARYAEELEGLREVVSLHEAVVDTDAYRLAAGITCRPGQDHSCGDAHHIGRCYKPSAEPSGTEAGSATEAKKHQLPVCASCGHRHRWGGECADHSWGDSCPYDAGADCELAAEDTAGMQPCQPIGCDNGHHLAGCRFADIDGSGEVS